MKPIVAWLAVPFAWLLGALLGSLLAWVYALLTVWLVFLTPFQNFVIWPMSSYVALAMAGNTAPSRKQAVVRILASIQAILFSLIAISSLMHKEWLRSAAALLSTLINIAWIIGPDLVVDNEN